MSSTDATLVVSQLQRLASTLSGIRQAPARPPEQMSEFPFAVSTLRRVNPLWETDWINALATFATQIHVARKDSTQDYSAFMAYGLTYPKLLFENPTLSGLVSTIIPDGVRVRLAIMEYGGQPTIGFDFEIDVKMRVDLNV